MFSFFKKFFKKEKKPSLTTLDKHYYDSVSYKKAINTFPEKVLSYYRHTIVRQGMIDHVYPEYIVDKAKKELVIFLYLSQFHSLMMPSRLVDELWHVFLQHSKEYREWCMDNFNTFIEHKPEPLEFGKSRFELYNEKPFVNRYSKEIIDTLWFYNIYSYYTSYDIFTFDSFYLKDVNKNGYYYDLNEINKVIISMSKETNRIKDKKEIELPDEEMLDNVISLIKKAEINSNPIEIESKSESHRIPVSTVSYSSKSEHSNDNSSYNSSSKSDDNHSNHYTSSYSSSSSSGSSCGSSCSS
jgi:hypothetical protein